MPLTPDDVQMIAGIVAQMRVGTLPPYLLSAQLEIKQSVTGANPTAGTQIVGGNANRVLLAMSGNTNNVNLQIAPISFIGATSFLQYNFIVFPILFTVQQHGLLPQLPWFVGASYTGTIYVLEMIWRPAS